MIMLQGLLTSLLRVTTSSARCLEVILCCCRLSSDPLLRDCIVSIPSMQPLQLVLCSSLGSKPLKLKS